jgi:hypothetical protein
MKKHLKRLVLHRETLLELDRLDTRLAAGGVTVYTGCDSFCPAACEQSNHPYINTCYTCADSCTTNLC